MSKVIKINGLEEIATAAHEFVEYVSSSPLQSNIFAFFGPMGAGKTTFIKAICNALEVTDDVNSPTFTIVNEYRAGKGFPVYHFDFYRINKISEAYDIGIDEYFGAEGLCLIEWPEKIEEILPQECFKVTVSVNGDGTRSIFIDDSVL